MKSFSPIRSFSFSRPSSASNKSSEQHVALCGFRRNLLNSTRRAGSARLANFHDDTATPGCGTATDGDDDFFGPFLDQEHDPSQAEVDDDGSQESSPVTEAKVQNEFQGTRKQSKRRHSRIARPKDSMPGYRKRCRSSMSHRSSKHSRKFSGSLSAKHKGRGVTLSAYFGQGQSQKSSHKGPGTKLTN